MTAIACVFILATTMAASIRTNVQNQDDSRQMGPGLARDRCKSRQDRVAALYKGRARDDLAPYNNSEFSSSLGIVSTARGQDAAEWYTLPSTRLYICYDPAPGTPSAFLYVHGQEKKINIQGPVIWADLLANLLRYSGISHGHSHAECSDTIEFLWVVDDKMNVVVAPQWEILQLNGSDTSPEWKNRITKLAALSQMNGTPIEPSTFKEIVESKSIRDKDSEHLKRKCDYDGKTCAGFGGRLSENACFKCVGRILLKRLTAGWFRETKHGDLTPGATPIRAAVQAIQQQPKAIPDFGELKIKPFKRISKKENDDVVFRGRFRGPARAGGEVIGCTDGSSLTKWFVNNLSGYSLYRVPLSAWESYLSEIMGKPLMSATEDEVISTMQSIKKDDIKQTFMQYSSLQDPSLELSMKQLCQATELMKLPNDSELTTIANKQHITKAQCGPLLYSGSLPKLTRSQSWPLFEPKSATIGPIFKRPVQERS